MVDPVGVGLVTTVETVETELLEVEAEAETAVPVACSFKGWGEIWGRSSSTAEGWSTVTGSAVAARGGVRGGEDDGAAT